MEAKESHKSFSLSDTTIAIVFLLSIISVFTIEPLINFFILTLAFLIIDILIFNQCIPRLISKLGKCSFCNSKSVKFFGWNELDPLHPVSMIEWNFMSGNFKVLCKKCKKTYTANFKIRTIYFLLFIIGIISPIFIYGFILLPFVGFESVNVTKTSIFLFPVLVLVLIYVYFRLNKNLY